MPSSAFVPLGHHSRSSQGSQHEHLRHSVCSEQSKIMLLIFYTMNNKNSFCQLTHVALMERPSIAIKKQAISM